MKNIICTLESRGFIDAVTSENIQEVTNKPVKVYVGFDPTSDSLHLGNFMGIMALSWFQKFGHTPIAIVGGATGMIGDPSGRSAERNLLDSEAIEKNLVGIERSLKSILDFSDPKTKPLVLNNHDWYADFNLIDFLRDVGKHFRMGGMLGKDAVKSRLETADGMSFTEFSYQLLQSYDFLHLYDKYGVMLQMGGSDQWGNITAGTELVRKMRGEVVYGLTFPLLTRSDGKKFGKSEGGAIWLNADKLSHYDFYQYLYRIPDKDVIKLLTLLTFLELEEIKEIEMEMQERHYIPHTAQRRLAEEVTLLVHGKEGLESALSVTQAAKPGAKTLLDLPTFESLAHEIPTKEILLEEVIGSSILDLLMKTEILPSKSEGRRLLAGGGVYLNNEKVIDEKMKIEKTHLVGNRFLLLSLGKKKKIVVKVK